MKVVSANYRDRNSDFPWLVRDESEHPDNAVAYKFVKAVNVNFCPSSAFEEGFGCSTIALCEEVEASNEPLASYQGEVARLRFDGVYFYYGDKSKVYVEKVAELHLVADKSMSAIIVAAVKESKSPVTV